MLSPADRFAELAHERFLRLQDGIGVAVGRLWDVFGGVDDKAFEQFPARAAVAVSAAQRQASGLVDSSWSRIAALLGVNLAPLGLQLAGADLRGTDPVEVYRRPVVTARAALADGRSWLDAVAAARARAVSTASTDVSLAQRGAADAWASADRVVGYRRVLSGRSCLMCATASTQRYRHGDLMPIHGHCDCGVAPIIGDHDPGHVINRGLLRDLRKQGGSSYWQKSGFVDMTEDGTATVLVGGKQRTLEVAVHQHGELGPVLTDRRHNFASEGDLAA